MKNAEELDSAIIYDRDYTYDYFGFKTLERSYLLRVNGTIAERPQHMLMRVSVGIHKTDIAAAIETYNFMSQKFFTHARCELVLFVATFVCVYICACMCTHTYTSTHMCTSKNAYSYTRTCARQYSRIHISERIWIKGLDKKILTSQYMYIHIHIYIIYAYTLQTHTHTAQRCSMLGHPHPRCRRVFSCT